MNYGYQAGAGQMGSGSTSGNSGQLVSVSGTINGQNRNQAFTYDNVGRLVTATGWGVWARRFGYDRHGNRTAVWDAVSGGSQLQNTLIEQVAGIKTNRIASVNETAFNYDASGNVTGDGARAYTYDAENRIASVSGLSSESYGYDAGNGRVKKDAGGVVTHYIREGDQVIAEYEYGGGSTPATGTRYYHQDRLSTRIITDGAGAVVGTTDHLPFGEEIGVSGESKKHKFTTYERDGTGLDYAVNRYYTSQQGRFNQADPLGMGASSLADPQSLNLYSYVQNDPVNSVDPLGLDWTVILARTDNGGGGGGGFGIGFCGAQHSLGECGGFGGMSRGNFGDRVAEYNREYGGLSEPQVEALREHNERVANAQAGNGYRTNEEVKAAGAAAEALFSEYVESNRDPIRKLVEAGIVRTTVPMQSGAEAAVELIWWTVKISGAAIVWALAIIGILAQEGDKSVQTLTLFRHADGHNPGAFRVDLPSSTDPGGVSVFEFPNPDKKFNIPFIIRFKGPKVPGLNVAVVGLPGVRAIYSPPPDRHWSLQMPGTADDAFKTVLSEYAKKALGIKSK